MTQDQPVPAWPPTSRASFVGRERETAEVIRLIQNHRLVTVTGPGGVGKTRLAVEVVRKVADQFPDGVYFVELSAVTDEARVPTEIAAALGIRQAPGRSAQEMLTAVLAAQRLLLVLDNCEHLLTAVSQLCGDQLKTADDLRILATSREQLWVSGEIRYRLSPLQLPGAGGSPVAEPSAAVALFAERYYGPVRRHAPRRYSAPRRFSGLVRSLSPPLTCGRGISARLPVFPHASRRPGSRHLHAGHRLASKRVSARLIPGQALLPRF